MLKKFNKEFIYQNAHKVSEICKPIIDAYDVTFFNSVRIFKDGSRATLTNSPDFIVDYYNNPSLYLTKEVKNMELKKEPFIVFTEDLKNADSYIFAREVHNIDNGFTISIPGKNYTDLFYFATKRDNKEKTELYKNSLDDFFLFINYYKEKARDLIKESSAHPFFLEGQVSIKNFENQFSTKLNCKSMDLNRFYVSEFDDKYLTKREAVVLFLMLKSFSAKEIARVLSISHRTVEDYVEKIKFKLGCFSKKELHIFIYENNLNLLLDAFVKNELNDYFSQMFSHNSYLIYNP